jgi:hypothetical protein
MNNKYITNNITLDKKNPLLLIVSCTPLGIESPTVYIQTNKSINKIQKKKN